VSKPALPNLKPMQRAEEQRLDQLEEQHWEQLKEACKDPSANLRLDHIGWRFDRPILRSRGLRWISAKREGDFPLWILDYLGQTAARIPRRRRESQRTCVRCFLKSWGSDVLGADTKIL